MASMSGHSGESYIHTALRLSHVTEGKLTRTSKFYLALTG